MESNKEEKKRAALIGASKGVADWSKELKKRFDELGFEWPETEEQCILFDEKFKDYPYKLKPEAIDPHKILNDVKNNNQWKAIKKK